MHEMDLSGKREFECAATAAAAPRTGGGADISCELKGAILFYGHGCCSGNFTEFHTRHFTGSSSDVFLRVI